jgi:hypothetical protein
MKKLVVDNLMSQPVYDINQKIQLKQLSRKCGIMEQGRS